MSRACLLLVGNLMILSEHLSCVLLNCYSPNFGSVFWHDPLCFQCCRNIQEMWSCEWELFFAEQWYQHPIRIVTDFFSVMLFTFWFYFLFQCYHFSFLCCTFTFGQFPLSTIQFYYKMSHGITQRQRKAASYVLCCLCMHWMNRCSVINPDRRWKKRLDRLLAVMAVSYLPSDWWAEELTAKFVLHAIAHT